MVEFFAFITSLVLSQPKHWLLALHLLHSLPPQAPALM
jgi:hypothetical protein